MAYKPGSVHRTLSERRIGSHSSATPFTRCLMRHTRDANQRQLICIPYLVLLQAGFTVRALLPDPRWALTPPFHPYRSMKKRRFAFCGTFPRFTPGGHYPPPCLYGARTFLQTRITPCPATARPSDRKRFYPRFVCLPRNLVQPARTASRLDFVSIVSDLQHRQSRSLGCTRDIIFKQSPLQ